MLKLFTAAIAVFTVNLALSTCSDDAIGGRISELNKPGTIAVQISVGNADGVQQGDEFVVQRNKRDIGRLVVIHIDQETAIANIIAVDDKLEIGDTINAASSTGSDDAIWGKILSHNKPGTIAVRITVGDADGVQQGDEFVVQRNKKDIGRLVVIHVDEETAIANITAVDGALERGDYVVHK